MTFKHWKTGSQQTKDTKNPSFPKVKRGRPRKNAVPSPKPTEKHKHGRPSKTKKLTKNTPLKVTIWLLFALIKLTFINNCI